MIQNLKSIGDLLSMNNRRSNTVALIGILSIVLLVSGCTSTVEKTCLTIENDDWYNTDGNQTLKRIRVCFDELTHPLAINSVIESGAIVNETKFQIPADEGGYISYDLIEYCKEVIPVNMTEYCEGKDICMWFESDETACLEWIRL